MKIMPITVLGGTSLIGKYLLPRLIAEGYSIQCLTRQQINSGDNKITWHKINDDIADIARLQSSEILIHLAPIWVLPFYLPTLVSLGIKRLIVFSSTSRFTKQTSESDYEQGIVKKLSDAETQIEAYCNLYQINWTILRPTLIYGDLQCGDPTMMGKGLATIVKFTNLFHIFPLVGKGQGLRQPVHADDLALACLQVLDNLATYNKAYNLSGGEIVNYRQMIERISLQCNNKIILLSLPLFFIRMLIGLIRLIPRYRFLTLAMADRMNQDMTFEHNEAIKDFGYKPRKFMSLLG